MAENYSDPKNNIAIEEEESSFDIMKWVFLVLKYWYLFVISVGIAIGLAYFSNRSWTPTYKTAAKVVMQESNNRQSGDASSIIQGFNLASGYRSVNNQLILFSSADLTRKAVERMKLDVDYYSKGRFKTNNLYKLSPIEVTHDYLSDKAAAQEFQFKSIDDNSYEISCEGDDSNSAFSAKGQYGVPLKNSMFFITINKTDKFQNSAQLYFKFRSISSWVSDFNARLSFNFVMERASVVEVSMVGKVSERDKDFIDTLCVVFLDDNLDRKNETATKTIDFIDRQMTSIADSLNVAEANLRNFRTANKMLDIGAYSGQIMGKINSLDQKKLEMNLRKTYMDYLSDYLKGNIEDGKIVAPSNLGVMDPNLMVRVKEFSTLQEKQSEVGKKSPYYKKYETQIETAKTALFEVLNNMYVAYNIELRDMEKQYAEQIGKLTGLPDKESQMTNYQRVFKIQDNYYTFMLQKRAEAQIQKASNTSDNIILETAQIKNVINGAEKAKKQSTNLMIGLIIPLIFIFLKEFLNTTIKDKNDIKKYTHFSILGVIQKGTFDKNPLLVLKNPKSVFSESFRLVRTRLEFIMKSKSNKKSSLILITSAESGDGKSFFSINLAGIYAMEKRKVLLIDLDLRKPSVGKSMSIENVKKGITNYIIGQASLEDILIEGDKQRPFDIILPGTIPPNPGELVKSDRLKELLDNLRETYEYIIIDTSPIGLVGDSYALTFNSDVNLFIVRQEKTNKNFFKNVIEQVKQDNIPNMYIVLNGVDVKNSNTSYTYHGYLRKSYYTKGTKNKYYNDYYES
ncbi:MAG: polysaccharide biosynthesis tyrosine autokinase [Prevotellaceae bacterium]|jgi:capsular exopolysaccharide synthesis family protein|nr:polysaccharide biosynthesis tyrosine autokinase [Prevotellaceae bacterium]